jgi:hypothetical protein
MRKLHSCLKHFRLFPLIALALISQAEAGVFNIPRFVEPGKNAVGFEPEIVLTNGGGGAANIRYTQGLTALSNLHGILGTGTGRRKFRIGTAMTFDFFPDNADQPGMGVAAQGLYYRYEGDVGQLETSLIPYIHKAFHSGTGSQVEPYFALPFGPSFVTGEYFWQTQVVLGAMFRNDGSALNFIGEVGVNVNKTESYFSGGILYQP